MSMAKMMLEGWFVKVTGYVLPTARAHEARVERFV